MRGTGRPFFERADQATLEVPRALDRIIAPGYFSHMKKASLTETKNSLSALVDRVRHGETVLIFDRGRAVAKLISVLDEGPSPTGRLERLERQGVIRRGSAPMPRKLLASAPPRAKGDVLAALLAERDDGR